MGGTLEAGEQPLQTALRELFEETGFRPDQLFFFGLGIPHADLGKSLATFVAYVDETTPVTLNDEHSDYLWMTGAEAVNLVPDHSTSYLEHLRAGFIVEPYNC